MNYQELVLSKSPNGYVNYNTGSAVDLVGNFTTTLTTVDLNPVYDYTAKQHGMRSKKIGHLGSGTYDRINFNTGALTFWHVEGWVYLTAANTTDVIDLFPFWVNGTYPSSARILTSRKVRWTTQSSSNGTGDNNLDSVGVIPLNQWTHIAVQFYGGVKKIFINGVLDTGTIVSSHSLQIPADCSYTPVTLYFDEYVLWARSSSAGMPTDAEILERATFPKTKTKVWDATNGFWIASGDERYWNGTQWVSMQDYPYKVWNGTDWVAVPNT